MDGDKLLSIAEGLKPNLISERVKPSRFVELTNDENCLHNWRVDTIKSDNLFPIKMAEKESLTVDFGDHHVGYLSFKWSSYNRPVDAPVRFKITIGEMPCEIGDDITEYNGWICPTWYQEEIILMDNIPGELKLSRRYAFRYVNIEILNISQNTYLSLDSVEADVVSSADDNKLLPLNKNFSDDIIEMDRIAVKTLKDCMQDVFEDGPKRDRRLWLGDLRLEAITNYVTYQNYDLVKRCLYLFGALTDEEGWVSPCIFTNTKPQKDVFLLYDYSLLFVPTLWDYYVASEDKDILKNLWNVAFKQLELGASKLDENYLVKDRNDWWCFIDWADGLNKQASAQAILLYSLKAGLSIAELLEESKAKTWINMMIDRVTKASKEFLWDDKLKLFVSGSKRNISLASQVWMVLAEVFPKTESAELLDRIIEREDKVKAGTPYMYHHLIDALFLVGKDESAISEMKKYWGEMITDGADTFWEVYDPEDKKFSPYGGNLVNSYCHAWSCTPSYFIRTKM